MEEIDAGEFFKRGDAHSVFTHLSGNAILTVVFVLHPKANAAVDSIFHFEQSHEIVVGHWHLPIGSVAKGGKRSEGATFHHIEGVGKGAIAS